MYFQQATNTYTFVCLFVRLYMFVCLYKSQGWLAIWEFNLRLIVFVWTNSYIYIYMCVCVCVCVCIYFIYIYSLQLLNSIAQCIFTERSSEKHVQTNNCNPSESIRFHYSSALVVHALTGIYFYFLLTDLNCQAII